MTSLAFTFGVLPMALASGAGQGSQHAIATGVVGGMNTDTVLAIFFIPLFFVVVMSLSKKKTPAADNQPALEGDQRSEEHRVGKERLRTVRSRSSPAP